MKIVQNATIKKKMKSSIIDFLQYPFLITGSIAAILLSICFGIISPIIVTRKTAFIGASISHSTILGLAISISIFPIESYFKIFITTLIITEILVFFLAYTAKEKSIPPDSLIGVFFATTMSLGLIIYQLFANSKGDLLSFLFGDILLIDNTDIIILLTLTFTIIISFIPFIKRWIYYSMDLKGTYNRPIIERVFHYGFYFLMTALIICSIKLAGAVLVNALLVIPGIYAIKCSKNSKEVFIKSCIFSISSAIIGIWLSNLLSLTSGPILVLVQFLLLIILNLKNKLCS